MKYAILSDIHANLEALQAVLQDAEAQRCTHIVCLGDIVGGCANPKECLDIIRGLKIPCVKGDHDEHCGTDTPLTGFQPKSAKVIEWTRRQLTPEDQSWLKKMPLVETVAGFTMVHATLDQPERWGLVFDKLAAAASFQRQESPICFFGHTLVPVVFVCHIAVRGGTYSKFQVESERKYFVNVGAVNWTRDGNPRVSYATYDLDSAVIELRRVDYDMPAAKRKIEAAGL